MKRFVRKIWWALVLVWVTAVTPDGSQFADGRVPLTE